jgi:hypothetical protein
MSQQEIQNSWDSFCQILGIIIPLILVSGIVSICNFFQRHWGVEPFKLSKLLIGILTDIVYGTLVGLAAIGSGRHYFIAWAIAGIAVHCGIRNTERVVKQLLYNRYQIKEVKPRKKRKSSKDDDVDEYK